MSPARPHPHFAAFMLLVATAAWSLSFSLNKDAGAAMNQLAGKSPGDLFGPTAFQGVRFLLAAIVWFAFIPKARQGWTLPGLLRGTYVGTLLAAGIILQHLALDRTTPAATAFLTSTTVLWVPFITTALTRKPPRPILLVGVALALVGLYLMLGEGLRTFRAGEMLGLACAVVFSFHLLAVSSVARKEGPWRTAGIQFALTGVLCLVPTSVLTQVPLTTVAKITLDPQILCPLLVVLAFPTLIAFGLMNLYQYQVDATRAVIIYQAESLMAAGFDFLRTGRSLTPIEFAGAALVLLANVIAERASTPPAEPVGKERSATSPPAAASLQPADRNG